MSRDLRLQVVLSAVDRLTRPLKSAQATNQKLAQSIKATKDQLKKLNGQAGDIASFVKNKNALGALSDRMARAQERVKALSLRIKENGDATGKLTQRQQRAINVAGRLKDRFNNLNQSLQRERSLLAQNGINTNRLASAQADLNRRTQQATAALRRQEQQLRTRGTALANYQKMRGAAGGLAMSGGMAMARGGMMLYAMKPALAEEAVYTQHMERFRSQGVTEQQIATAQNFVDHNQVIGNSKADMLKLYAEGYAITRDEHHAHDAAIQLARAETAMKMLGSKGLLTHEQVEMIDKMSYALLKNAELRNEIQDPKQLASFINESVKTFAVNQTIITPEDTYAFMKRGGLAAKYINRDEYFYAFGHLIQEMGGESAGNAINSARQNLISKRIKQRSSDELDKLGLVQNVKYSRTGHVKDFKLINERKFVESPYKYLIEEIVPRIEKVYPELDESGIMQKISDLFSNRTAADLFATMYQQRANIQKQMAAGKRAQGIDEIIGSSQQNAAGQELILSAKKRDLYKQIGETILPMYVKGLELINGMLTRISGFIERHPKLAKYFIATAVGLALTATAGGALTLVLASMIGPLAVLRYGFVALAGRELPSVIGMFKKLTPTNIGRGFSWLARLPLKAGRAITWLVRSPFSLLRTAFMGLSAVVAALGWPVTALIAALVAGAFAVYKYWDRVKAWFGGFVEGLQPALTAIGELINRIFAPLKPVFDWVGLKFEWVGQKISAVIDWFKEFLSPVKSTKEELKAAADSGKGFGSAISDSILSAIDHINKLIDKLAWVKNTLSLMGGALKEQAQEKVNAIVDWVKKKTGNNSPSAMMSPSGLPYAGMYDSGGSIPSGKFGIAGENGPEIINGPARITSRRNTAAIAAAAMMAFGFPTQSAAAPMHPYVVGAGKKAISAQSPGSRGGSAASPFIFAPQIHVHATPGQNVEDIANQVMRKLQALERQAKARARSTFNDQG
ncbi:phage tail tape measure protein [Serratia fonticola]